MDLQVPKVVLRYGLASLVSLLLAACGQHTKVSQVPYYNSPDFTPLWLTEQKQIDTLHQVAPFRMKDQDGQMLTDDSLKGKIYVTGFFFTSCPNICPKLTRNMQMTADTFRNNAKVKFLMYSVTPDIDSVPRLHNYAKRYNISSRQWKLLTGNKTDIYQLARRSYFAEQALGFNKDSTQFLHTEHFVLVDGNKHLRGLYNGTLPLDMQRMSDDIKILLRE